MRVFAVMAKHEDRDKIRDSVASDVAVCVQTLNHTIGELARRYGAVSVVVALTEVMGCASCATDSVKRGSSLHALLERMSSMR